MLQCLARRIQGLDISQLELATLALASLSGIPVILWWDKPLGALKRKLTDVSFANDEPDPEFHGFLWSKFKPWHLFESSYWITTESMFDSTGGKGKESKGTVRIMTS